MDPVSIAMIGSSVLSGAGALGGLLGSGSQKAAAAAQNDIAFRNYYLQRQLAQQQQELATAGSQDARGNRTEYIPGVGWVERPTDQTRGIIGASDTEERLRLTQDAGRGRRRREDNTIRQGRDGQEADAIMGGIRTGQQTLPDLRAALIEAQVARAMSGANDARSRIGMQGLRTGTGGQAAIAQLGRNAQMDTRTAIADARLDAPSEYQNRRTERVAPRINQSGALQARASAPDDVQFQPTQVDQGLSGMLRSRMNVAPQAIGSAMSVRAPNIANVESRTPVALDSLGQYLQGLAKMGGGTGGKPEARGRSNSDWEGIF